MAQKGLFREVWPRKPVPKPIPLYKRDLYKEDTSHFLRADGKSLSESNYPQRADKEIYLNTIISANCRK